jgi:hypothetical protein
MTHKQKHIGKAVGLGIASLVLYALLFGNEQMVIELTRQGKWTFIVPIAIAFVFSFVHGAFTGQFWDVLGVKAKK